MAALRIPLVGSFTNRKLDTSANDAKDQFFVNCFPEIVHNPITGRSTVYLNKRPGVFATAIAGVSGGSYASIVWGAARVDGETPVVVTMYDTPDDTVRFYDVTDGTPTEIGGGVATQDGCLFLEESDVGGTPNLTATLYHGTDPHEVWYFPQGGAWTQITDSDFPSDFTKAHAHMDGYMFVMTEGGRIYNSDLNSLSSWTATSYITANSLSDGGIGVARYRNYIVGFGEHSIEFFVNRGNPTGSVLSRLPDATINIGAQWSPVDRPPSIRAIGDTVYWVGQEKGSGKVGIYRLSGMQAEKISNSAVDRIVANGHVKFIIGSFSLMGMTHVAFFAGVNKRILCYCVDTKYWWYWDCAIGTNQTIVGIAGTATTPESESRLFCVTNSTAAVYEFDPSGPVWQDDGTAYTMTVQTGNMDFGTRRQKFWQAVSIIGDIEASTSEVGIATSDDDYANFSAARNIDMSTQANRIVALGASRRRAWKLTHSANTPCRLEALEIEYELGAH